VPLRIETCVVCVVVALTGCASAGSDQPDLGLGTKTPGGGSGGSGSGGSSGSGSGGASGGGGGDDSVGSQADGGGLQSGPDSGGAAGDDGGAGDDGATPPTNADSDCFPSVSDFTAAGPFAPTNTDVTSVACTIFRPTTFAKAGCVHPVIVWGNGTFNTPSSYTDLFNHFASQGFIVAAADTSNSGSGTEMLACLQYVIDQNGMAGSDLAGHVDVMHIASSGYSQGGAGCLEAGLDPRFTAIAAVSPYIVIPLGGYDTTSVMKQIHPLFMISGDADTVAVPANNQQPIFDMAPVPIVWATHAGSTHFEVLGNGGAYAGPLTAWFRYKLMGDASARNVFEKPACTLCSTTGWTVQFNSLWK
jgi:dienelactone hydrolase